MRDSSTIRNPRMSHSLGKPLEIPADAPLTMTEAMLRSVFRAGQSGILQVKGAGTEQFLSYSSLLDSARRVATGLRNRGLEPGDAAILQFDDVGHVFTAFWGCVLAGVVPTIVAVPATTDRDNGTSNKLLAAWNLLKSPAVLCEQRSTGQ